MNKFKIAYKKKLFFPFLISIGLRAPKKIKRNPFKRKRKDDIFSVNFDAFQASKEKQSPIKADLSRKKLSQINLDSRVKMILLGSLLGDGSINIQKNYVNARFQMRHSGKQESWFNWKVSILRSLATDKSVHKSAPDGFQKKSKNPTGKLHFQTRALPVLTEIFKIVEKGGKKYIQRSWLNHLNAEALMVWWLDDGSLVKNHKNGIFCTHGFSEKEVKILSQYLKRVWGVHTTLSKVKKKVSQKNSSTYEPTVLRLNTTNLVKFLRIIMPYVPVESMLYKLCIGYVDLEHQQRWISELKQAFKKNKRELKVSFEKKIEEIYALRKKESKKPSSF
jgi:hypothetical protein